MKTILQVLEATEGGTRRHLRDLVGALDPEEFRCALAVSCRRDPGFAADVAMYRSRGMSVTELRMVRGISPLADLTALLALIRCVRRARPDLIHAHSAKAGFLARLAGMFCRVPVVYTPHVFSFMMACGACRRAAYRALERCVRPATAALIAVSKEEEREALALRHPRDRVFHIPNGVALAAEGLGNGRHRGRPSSAGGRSSMSAAVVGFFGRLVLQKGADVLLAAAVNVATQFPDARFVFHGDGELADALRAKADVLGLADRVSFAGAYSQADAVGLMRQTDVVAVPSRWEGCPYVVLEAFQAGVPVVASAMEIVQDGLNGLCVPPENPAALADALLALLRDPDLRRRLAERGCVCAAEHTVDAMARAVAGVYRAVLQ